MDKETLAGIRISTEWAVGVGSMLALIAGMGVLTRTAIVLLVIAGICGLSIAAFEHGWLHRPLWRAFLVVAVIWVGMSFIGYKTWPPKETIKITPTVTWFPSSLKAGEPLTSAQLNATALVDGIPIAAEPVYNPTFGATLPAGAQTLSVTFTSNDLAYNSVSRTITVQVLAPPVKVLSKGDVHLVPERVTGGVEAGNVVKVWYLIKNETGAVVRVGGIFHYAIGPTISDSTLEAEKEDEFWEIMQHGQKTKAFFDIPTGRDQRDNISSTPLTIDQSKRLKDGSYTMFFMSSYGKENSKKPLAGLCGTVNSAGEFRLCYHHNFP